MSFLLHPYFCPFLLLEYNKEAGKNIAYTRTLGEISGVAYLKNKVRGNIF